MDKNITDIISSIEFLLSLDKDYLEIDDDGLLEKEHRSNLKCLVNLPNKKWNDTFFHKALSILKEYQEDIENFDLNIDFDTIQEIDKKIRLSFSNNHIISNEVNDYLKDCFGDFIEENNQFIFDSSNIDFSKLLLREAFNCLKLDKSLLHFFNINCNSHNFNINNIFDRDQDFKKTPLNYQKFGILFGLINKKIILADEMGLGKSLQSLFIAEYSQKLPALIVCPSTFKLNWVQEISSTLYRTSHILTNTKKVPEADFYIVNYESLHNYVDLIKSMNIQFMIFDETHFIKNPKARRTKSSLEIAKISEYTLALTGTPLLNRPTELSSQLELINKLDDLGGYWGFSYDYCDCKDTNWGWDTKGNSNLDQLSLKLRETCLIRREKKDVLKELPEKRRTYLPIQICNQAEYNEVDEKYNNETDRSIKQSLYHERNKIIALGKLNEMKKIVSDFHESNEKVIIFAHYKEVIDELRLIYPDALTITAEESCEERFKNAEKFQNDSEERIIICSIAVANAGFNLFAASNILFLEFDSVEEINCQCESRAHRLGQLFSVNSWFLKAINTYDEKKIENLSVKEKITSDVKNGYKNLN